jgi:hypothetical protein
MIERFDHRPMLTATLALATIVLLVVVVTLSTILITFQPAASPQSVSGGNSGAAEAPANMDAGGENYGWDILHKSDSSGGNPAGRTNRATPGENYGWDIHNK